MNFNPNLYVEIHPFEGEHQPHPDPIRDGRFSTDYVYKVLGVYNPSETSECYFMLVNPERQVWFIPQRHLLAYRLIDSDEFFLPRPGRSMAASPMRSTARHTPGAHVT